MKVTRKWLVVFVLTMFTLGVGIFQRRSVLEQYYATMEGGAGGGEQHREIKRNMCINVVCGARPFDTTCVTACEEAIANAPKCTSNYPIVTDSTNINWGEDVHDGVSVKCVHLN